MTRKPKDLTGKRFGRLLVIEHSERRNGHQGHQWVCQCDCGKYLICRVDNLTSGHTTQCSLCAGKRGHGSIFVERGDDV